MEDLTTTQTILLCLLVSFVTSIGTGIITSSLLQEAPQNVTQTINRVVERTVQTIVPQTNTDSAHQVTTVVVKEEDLVIDAIKKTHSNLVWIISKDSSQVPVIQTVGVVVKKDGTILADKHFVSSDNVSYSVTFFSDGQNFPVTVVGTSKNTNAIFLKPTLPLGSTRTFAPAPLNASDLQLGQTVIALGGKAKESVAIGRVSSVNLADVSAQATSTKVIQSIETDTPLRDLIPGSVLLNLNGEIAGFENFDADTNKETLYTSINVIKQENPTFFE